MDKVAGIILLVNDLEESVMFYNKLGFTVTEERPGIATIVAFGGFWVELLLKSKVVSEEYKEGVESTSRGAGIYLQIRVKDVDAFYETIETNGVQVSGKPENYPWQQRELVVTDPDGYKMAFFSPI